MRQGELFAPIPVRDRHVTAAERPRLSRQSAAILERLQRGPASNFELAEIAIRYSARIFDLKGAGYVVEIVETDHATGRRVYALR